MHRFNVALLEDLHILVSDHTGSLNRLMVTGDFSRQQVETHSLAWQYFYAALKDPCCSPGIRGIRFFSAQGVMTRMGETSLLEAGYLLWLSTMIRPDIANAVQIMARHSHSLWARHSIGVQNFFSSLTGTRLWV